MLQYEIMAGNHPNSSPLAVDLPYMALTLSLELKYQLQLICTHGKCYILNLNTRILETGMCSTVKTGSSNSA